MTRSASYLLNQADCSLTGAVTVILGAGSNQEQVESLQSLVRLGYLSHRIETATMPDGRFRVATAFITERGRLALQAGIAA